MLLEKMKSLHVQRFHFTKERQLSPEAGKPAIVGYRCTSRCQNKWQRRDHRRPLYNFFVASLLFRRVDRLSHALTDHRRKNFGLYPALKDAVAPPQNR
jgi:hypothetical protein